MKLLFLYVSHYAKTHDPYNKILFFLNLYLNLYKLYILTI